MLRQEETCQEKERERKLDSPSILIFSLGIFTLRQRGLGEGSSRSCSSLRRRRRRCCWKERELGLTCMWLIRPTKHYQKKIYQIVVAFAHVPGFSPFFSDLVKSQKVNQTSHISLPIKTKEQKKMVMN